MGNSEALSVSLKKPVEGNVSLESIKKLIIYTCYPEHSLKDGKYKPASPVLTIDEVSKLSEDEIESIAKTYLEKNGSLYKDRKTWTETDEEDKKIHHSKYEGIKYPKEEEESYIEYLYRLLCLEDERMKNRMKDMMDSIPKLGGFSPNLQKAVAGNLVAGSVITEAMKTNNFFESNLRTAANSHRDINDDFMCTQARIAKAKTEPFDKLAEKLDTLIEFTSKSTENLVQGNSQQTQMGAEIKSVGDENNKLQKELLKETINSGDKSNKKTNIVIILTVVGIITGLSFCTKPYEPEENTVESQIVLNETKKDVETLKKSNASYEREVERLRVEIENLKNQSK
ncbi:hypothetical protein [Psychrobacter frigidicola]|uniref:hypothetical protein n=1 Tax=Psychrobacter frigidicola TaxID=45611 RepID=UPI00191AF64F|nr:hypothetical protein [Psychrobacter frigidicola]